MSLAKVFTRAQLGITAPLVTVEVHIANGLPNLSIVGLPATAVKESKERVRSAIINSHFDFPTRRITINLAPADLPKEGGRYDLAIAIGILAASNQLPKASLQDAEFIGELALSGELNPIRACISSAFACAKQNRKFFLPKQNIEEASLIKNIELLGANHLLQVTEHLLNKTCIETATIENTATANSTENNLSDIKGQQHAKRALIIAAAGGHSVLFTGPPGTGKTMLASRLPSLLPTMSDNEAIETASIYSLLGKTPAIKNWHRRPFRAPHHTCSAIALVGGGSNPMPGEISLAHNGILFLDELPEFGRKALEVLREPLESGVINISRAARQTQYPANFQLIAAMNPCPCGYLHEPRCNCTREQVQRYKNKISGPLLDRIDLHVAVPRIPNHLIFSQQKISNEPCQLYNKQIVQARSLQMTRSNIINSQLNNQAVEQNCSLDNKDQALLLNSIEKFSLSTRAYHRILKIARTIADLDDQPAIQTPHLTEALYYRSSF